MKTFFQTFFYCELRKIQNLFVISFCFILFYPNFLQAENNDNIEISLLTCGTGTEEVYEAFGHTAIRIKNKSDRTDLIYNYGMFDFYEEDFLSKFIRGKLLYYVDTENFNDFLFSYMQAGRSVREQVLNLNDEQKERLQKALNENLLPQNKYYLYDFIYNNCSTQPRDLIKKSIGEDFQFKTLQTENTETIRELIDKHTTYNEWLDLGIDLLLGGRTDKIADKYTRMFLPEELMIEFDSTYYHGQPIVSHSEMLFEGDSPKTPNLIHPFIVFSLILLIVILSQVFLPTFRWQLPVAISILSVVGIVGWILVFMWFGTDHYLTKWNLNLLWAIPFYFPLAFFLTRLKDIRWIQICIAICRTILFFLLIAWPFNPQQFHISVVPILLLSIWSLGIIGKNEFKLSKSDF
ncbi:MAG: DUF4105 domain-containing protein [Chitinophagales bacterium]|nr:DUF4105 domain-containing protein [Chitinophagales bacterium]